jgi:D-alanine--poly(phosphoribitol) ligase subunit 1
MILRELVQERLSSSFKLYNREGVLVPAERVREEYSRVRGYLLEQHSAPGNCVVIRQTKDYRYLLTMLACMEIGVPYVPLKHDYPTDRIEQIRQDTNFSLEIDDEKFAELLRSPAAPARALPELTGEEPVYIIFTSGSTGRPKGVVIQRRALENFFYALGEQYPTVTAADRLLQMTEFSFDLSVVDVGMFIVKNVAVYFSNFENNIFRLGFEVETYRISFLNTVPNNLNMFLSDLVADRMDYRCLKHLSLCGARFSYGLWEKCRRYFSRDVDVYNLYGPTEATVYSHGKKLSFQDPLDCVDGVVSIGHCLPNVRSLILVDGKVAGPNVRGELYIGGVQLLKEYVNDPAQTAAALVQVDGETFYKTGDLGFRTESDEYFIVGRADDTIKYRGFRINLLDVDSYVTRIPYVQDSVTIAVPNEATENQTIGFVILKETKTPKEFKQDLTKLLLDYQIPEKIIFVDKYPTNVSGKVCRKTLRAHYLEAQKA